MINRFFIIVFILLCNSVFGSNPKNLWPLWEITNPLSQKKISHSNWQTFLNKKVITNAEGINLIDYANLTTFDKKLLRHYISEMSTIKIQNYNRAEQLAFWLNIYNATVVEFIMRYYPINSVEKINISPGLFSSGPWDKKIIHINGIPLSLDDIKNRIVRPIWNDIRIHYAMNNGTIGAANLSKQAFNAKMIEEQLNHTAFEYINSYRGVQVIEGKLIVSKVFDWFSEDFGGTKQNIINHLEQYAREPLKSQLKHINTIDNYYYNWHLNSTVVTIS